jgi:hypothetical protein
MVRLVAILFIVVSIALALVKAGDLQVFSDILEKKIKSSGEKWTLLSKHFEEEENVLIVSWQITTASQELRSLMVVALAVRKIAHHVTITAPSEAKGRRLAKYIIDSVATFHRRK